MYLVYVNSKNSYHTPVAVQRCMYDVRRMLSNMDPDEMPLTQSLSYVEIPEARPVDMLPVMEAVHAHA